MSLEIYLRDAFPQRQQAVGLFFDLEKAYETIWHHPRPSQDWTQRQTACFCEWVPQGPPNSSPHWDYTDEFYPGEGVPTGGVLAVTCFGIKINELPSHIAMDIFRALFVDDLAICSCGRSLDTIERHLQQSVNAIQEWATRNGFRFAAHKCKVVHFTAPDTKLRDPPPSR